MDAAQSNKRRLRGKALRAVLGTRQVHAGQRPARCVVHIRRSCHGHSRHTPAAATAAALLITRVGSRLLTRFVSFTQSSQVL